MLHWTDFLIENRAELAKRIKMATTVHPNMLQKMREKAHQHKIKEVRIQLAKCEDINEWLKLRSRLNNLLLNAEKPATEAMCKTKYETGVRFASIERNGNHNRL